MFKPVTRAACLLFLTVPGPPAASLSVQPHAEGWAAPHLIFAGPVIVSLRLRCAGPQAAACVLVEPEGGWPPDPQEGRRVLREPFLPELAVEEPFTRGRFTFALPLNEDRSAVRFAPSAPGCRSTSRRACKRPGPSPASRDPVRVWAASWPSAWPPPPVDEVRSGCEAGNITGRRCLAGSARPTPFHGKEPSGA